MGEKEGKTRIADLTGVGLRKRRKIGRRKKNKRKKEGEEEEE